MERVLPYQGLAVTFNQALHASTVNVDTVYVAQDQEGNMPIAGIQVVLDPEDPRLLFVFPPEDGWEPGETLYLFITTTVQSEENGALPQTIRMAFLVEIPSSSTLYDFKQFQRSSSSFGTCRATGAVSV